MRDVEGREHGDENEIEALLFYICSIALYRVSSHIVTQLKNRFTRDKRE